MGAKGFVLSKLVLAVGAFTEVTAQWGKHHTGNERSFSENSLFASSSSRIALIFFGCFSFHLSKALLYPSGIFLRSSPGALS
jgi:hypothetical protein